MWLKHTPTKYPKSCSCTLLSLRRPRLASAFDLTWVMVAFINYIFMFARCRCWLLLALTAAASERDVSKSITFASPSFYYVLAFDFFFHARKLPDVSARFPHIHTQFSLSSPARSCFAHINFHGGLIFSSPCSHMKDIRRRHKKKFINCVWFFTRNLSFVKTPKIACLLFLLGMEIMLVEAGVSDYARWIGIFHMKNSLNFKFSTHPLKFDSEKRLRDSSHKSREQTREIFYKIKFQESQEAKGCWKLTIHAHSFSAVLR
jgi:hypothetical protein